MFSIEGFLIQECVYAVVWNLGWHTRDLAVQGFGVAGTSSVVQTPVYIQIQDPKP